MAKTLHRVFLVGFSLLWGWLFLNSVLRWRHNGAAALAAGLGLAALFFLLAKFAAPRLDQMCIRDRSAASSCPHRYAAFSSLGR